MLRFGSADLPRVKNDVTDLDERLFNRVFEALDRRLHELEELRVDWLQQTEQLEREGLNRIDQVLAPAFETVDNAATLGFLVGRSETSLTLVTGMKTFYINEGERGVFTPTPFLEIQREGGTVADFAYGALDYWEPITGELRIDIEQIEGAGMTGAHDDWVISASAGIWTRIGESIADIFQAKLDAIAAKDAAEDAFDLISDLPDRYKGPLVADPAGPHVEGDMYFNTTTKKFMVWNGIAYIQAATEASFVTFKSDFTATASQTVFTMPQGFEGVEVYLNGVMLKATDDYTVASPSITLTAGAAVGDLVLLRSYQYRTEPAPTSSYYTSSEVNTLVAAQVQAGLAMPARLAHDWFFN